MTRRLEEVFGIASNNDDSPILPVTIDEGTDLAAMETDAKNTLSKIEEALSAVKGLDGTDSELDELAAMAIDSFKDLHDRGMDVEARYSSEILSVAATMLGHAIGAKTAKINRKLKTLDLQLKQAQLEQKLSSSKSKIEDIDSDNIPTGQSLDRNELVKMLLERNSPTKS